MSNIKKDIWLSGVLEKESFSLVVSEDWLTAIEEESSGENNDFLDLLSKEVFVYAKVDPANIRAINMLGSYGFNLIDTNITLEKNISKDKDFKFNTTVRMAKNTDASSVSELSRKSFLISRFHLDPYINTATAKEINYQWAHNFFSGKRGDQLIVAEINDTIVGFNLLILKDDSVVIDLITVDSNYERKGIATDLINYAESINSGKAKIVVGTQAANIAALRLYEKCGFKVCNTKYVLHYHNPKD